MRGHCTTSPSYNRCSAPCRTACVWSLPWPVVQPSVHCCLQACTIWDSQRERESNLHGKPSRRSVLCWLHASCRPAVGLATGWRALATSGPADTKCSAVCRAACCGTGSWVPGPCPCRAGASPPEAGGRGGDRWLGCPLLRPQPEAHVAGLCQGDQWKATPCYGRLHAGVTQHLEWGDRLPPERGPACLQTKFARAGWEQLLQVP